MRKIILQRNNRGLLPGLKQIVTLLIFLLTLIGLGYGCAPKRSYASSEVTAMFRPPTLAPTMTATLPSTPTLSPDKPTLSSKCSDVLGYLSDQTVPDGMEVAPRSTMDKRWEVSNMGTCNWDADYRMKRIAGDAMGAPEEIALYPARSGTHAVIRILFTAPDEPGIHRSAWQAINPDGQPFGDAVYVEVNVLERTTPTP